MWKSDRASFELKRRRMWKSSYDPVFDWWNCSVPKGYDLAWVYAGVKAELEKLGFFGSLYIEMVAVIHRPSFQMIHRLKACGIPFIPANHSRQQASDEKIYERFGLWKETAPSSGVVVIMSGDKTGYDKVLSDVKSMNLVSVVIHTGDLPFTDADYNIQWTQVLATGKKLYQEGKLTLQSLGLQPYEPTVRLPVVVHKGYKLSAEEIRLWRIVNHSEFEMRVWANMVGVEERDRLLFKAWVSLIAVIEKNSECL